MDRAEVLVPIVIFIIVFVRIILSSVKASAKKDRQAKPAQAQGHEQTAARSQPNKPKPGTKVARPNRPKRGSQLAKPNKPSRGSGIAKPNKPARGTHTAKPNTPMSGGSARQSNTTIDYDYNGPLQGYVVDAKKSKHPAGGSNASKSSSSMKRQQTRSNAILEAARENTVEVEIDNDRDAIVTENLMDQVFEVMVKGPDDTLKFQRDFVAEGMEMLNRITLP